MKTQQQIDPLQFYRDLFVRHAARNTSAADRMVVAEALWETVMARRLETSERLRAEHIRRGSLQIYPITKSIIERLG